MKSPFLTSFFLLQLITLQAQEIYKSEDLIIQKLTDNTFIHISYLQTESFGKVACNGLIYISEGEAAVFDTPTTNEVSAELIEWLQDTLKVSVTAVIASHFHEDCLGGLEIFHKEGISSYGSSRTIALAKNTESILPATSFTDSLYLKIGEERVIVRFLGEGHTTDNVVAYIPSERVLFGGCLIKEIGAGEGFTGDANLQEWSQTVANVRSSFPEIQHVVPGHGKPGNTQLLEYTIALFDSYE